MLGGRSRSYSPLINIRRQERGFCSRNEKATIWLKNRQSAVSIRQIGYDKIKTAKINHKVLRPKEGLWMTMGKAKTKHRVLRLRSEWQAIGDWRKTSIQHSAFGTQ